MNRFSLSQKLFLGKDMKKYALLAAVVFAVALTFTDASGAVQKVLTTYVSHGHVTGGTVTTIRSAPSYSVSCDVSNHCDVAASCDTSVVRTRKLRKGEIRRMNRYSASCDVSNHCDVSASCDVAESCDNSVIHHHIH